MIIERANASHLDQVLSVLNASVDRLHERGITQRQNGFDAARIALYVGRGEMWVVREGGKPVATVRADSEADPDFWTSAESTELAMYVSILARIPSAAAGTGEILLRWITDHAASLGYRWVRLDAWPINTRLYQYCRDRGWTYLRTTVEYPHRRSGALFQRLALPDPEARSWLREPVPVPAPVTAGFEMIDENVFEIPDLG